jgi:hypothetical protein
MFALYLLLCGTVRNLSIPALLNFISQHIFETERLTDRNGFSENVTLPEVVDHLSAVLPRERADIREERGTDKTVSK